MHASAAIKGPFRRTLKGLYMRGWPLNLCIPCSVVVAFQMLPALQPAVLDDQAGSQSCLAKTELRQFIHTSDPVGVIILVVGIPSRQRNGASGGAGKQP